MLTGKLDNWKYDTVFNVVWGNLTGDVHKRWVDGMYIHTSNIVSPKPKGMKEGVIITTLNSTYELGKKYEAP